MRGHMGGRHARHETGESRCHCGRGAGGEDESGERAGDGGGGPPWARRGFEGRGAVFGVRRPLRFLVRELDLDDEQAGQLARFLDELKIEHDQAAVDARRATATLADAFERDELDAAKLADAAGIRVKTAERLRDAVVEQLKRMHAVLEPEQRRRFAFLVRSGALDI